MPTYLLRLYDKVDPTSTDSGSAGRHEFEAADDPTARKAVQAVHAEAIANCFYAVLTDAKGQIVWQNRSPVA